MTNTGLFLKKILKPILIGLVIVAACLFLAAIGYAALLFWLSCGWCR